MPEPESFPDGLVLAAGEGRRFGGSKLTEPLGGSTVLGGALASLAPFCAHLVVVCGAHAAVVAAARAALPAVILAENPEWEKGMFSSVLAGVCALPPGGALFILPGDIPLVAPAVCRALLDHAAAHPERICIPVYEGRRGHPVLLPAAAVARLRAADPAGNLRDFLHAEGFAEVPVADAGILRDIDTREDLAGLSGVSEPGNGSKPGLVGNPGLGVKPGLVVNPE